MIQPMVYLEKDLPFFISFQSKFLIESYHTHKHFLAAKVYEQNQSLVKNNHWQM
jgi:hypothetical protein